MHRIKKAVAVGVLMAFPLALSAAEFVIGGGSSGGGLRNPLKASTLTAFFVDVLRAVELIVFPFIVLFVVYGGFKFVTAQGNPEKIKEAKQVFFWVLVGALIILGAEVIARAIGATITNISA